MQRDAGAAQTVGITRTVETLVVREHHVGSVHKELDVADHGVPRDRMFFDDVAFLLCQWTWFQKDVLGDADFSHIVEVGAPLQVLELELGKIEHGPQLHAVL